MSEEIIVNATKSQLEDFKDSIIWADIVRELESWVEGFRRERDNMVEEAAGKNLTTAEILLHMGDINGRIKAIAYALSIPDVLISILETRSKLKGPKEVSDD